MIFWTAVFLIYGVGAAALLVIGPTEAGRRTLGLGYRAVGLIQREQLPGWFLLLWFVSVVFWPVAAVLGFLLSIVVLLIRAIYHLDQLLRKF